jgi:hypothetical protein
MVLIDQRSGVDVCSAHGEDPICAEKRKQIVSKPNILKVQTYYVHNEEIISDHQLLALIEKEHGKLIQSETQVDLCK